MMAELSRKELISLARTGAVHRLAELEAEMATIRRAFPGITTNARGNARPAEASPAGKRRRRRNRMTPEGRKRISDMMKRRWAERRKEKARAAK